VTVSFPLTRSVPAIRDEHPSYNTGDVDDLIAANQKDGKVRRFFAPLEMFDPPPNGHPGIDDHVNQSQNDPSDPSEDDAQQNGMNCPMDPAGWVRESNLVHGHPLILEQPVRNEMEHQSCFENSQWHGEILWLGSGGGSATIRIVPHIVPRGFDGNGQ
jgi:hypothetical protein